jgi:hypothetical protein
MFRRFRKIRYDYNYKYPDREFTPEKAKELRKVQRGTIIAKERLSHITSDLELLVYDTFPNDGSWSKVDELFRSEMYLYVVEEKLEEILGEYEGKYYYIPDSMDVDYIKNPAKAVAELHKIEKSIIKLMVKVEDIKLPFDEIEYPIFDGLDSARMHLPFQDFSILVDECKNYKVNKK